MTFTRPKKYFCPSNDDGNHRWMITLTESKKMRIVCQNCKFGLGHKEGTDRIDF